MKNVVVINDLSSIGNCSMTACLAVFSACQQRAFPVVTALYSRQTGFGSYSVTESDVSAFFCDVTATANVDACHVGFCHNNAMLRAVTSLLQGKKSESVFLTVDPVMGDNGAIYAVFDKSYVAEMKKLVSFADCITPNLTEACLLCDVDYNEVISRQNEAGFVGFCGKVFADILVKTGAKSAVITGIRTGNLIGNVVVTEEGVNFVTNDKVDVDFSGTGDLFSAVVTAKLLQGASLLKAVQVSAGFVSASAKQTLGKDGRFGVDFEYALDLLK